MHNQGENTRLIILISLASTLGGFLFGFDSGVINGTVDGLQQAFQSSSIGSGFNVASMLLGCAVGAFFAGRMADKFGRRSLLIVSAILFLISAWGSGIASASGEFVVYRILGGLAVGAASVMTPAYISEIAPARYRGKLATMQQIAIIGGLFSAFVSNYALAELAGSSLTLWWWGFETWRWMFWMEIVPAVVFLFFLLFIPESPRYLIMVKRTQISERVLTSLYGDVIAKQKYVEIEASLSKSHAPKLADVFIPGTRQLRSVVWIGIGLAVLQQLVGINVIFYYGAVLWQAVGFSESDALFTNVITGGLSIIACTLTVLLIEKIGRKTILTVGSVGMALSLAVIVWAFMRPTTGGDGGGQLELGMYGVVALIAANVYVFFFNFSWGPVMWVMLGEMFPNHLRGSGLAVAGFAQWLSNFAVTISFPVLLTGIGLAGAYSLYLLGAVASIVFVLRYVKETRGLELEQMSDL